jgi:hypothetical protein
LANLAITGISAAQQVADSAADLTVAHPAFRAPARA